MVPWLPTRRVASIQAAMPCSQGQRSSSVSGTPLCIFSTFEGGWNQSPSSKIQFSRWASINAIVLLPLPETPITTRTEGPGNGAAVLVCRFRASFSGASGATENAHAATQDVHVLQALDHERATCR